DAARGGGANGRGGGTRIPDRPRAERRVGHGRGIAVPGSGGTMSERNQCDGCALGMAVNENGNHVNASGRIHMDCTRDRYEASETEQLRARIAELEFERDALKRELADFENDLADAEDDCRDLRDEVANLKEQLAGRPRVCPHCNKCPV